MSLKSFVSQKDISTVLKAKIDKPNISYKKNILIEPQSKNYTNVGIAFDYLMRIYLYRLNKQFVQKFEMIADSAISERYLGQENYKIAVEIIKRAKKRIDCYLDDGILNDELLASCLQLSHLDIIKRSSIVPDNFGSYDQVDINDLKELFLVMEKHNWKCEERCELNPNFDIASLLVAGADADLIIDDMLIDIKTIKNPGISRQHFNQLLGYYFLSRIEGRVEINRLGIYSARYSDLIVFSISDVINKDDLSSLTSWFFDEAYKQHGNMYELQKLQRELAENL